MIDSRSIGESFHCRIGSSSRDLNRFCCSLSLTENQYFRSRMPSSTSCRSKTGHCRVQRSYSSSVQKPITRSTPPRLYQERSNRASSPRVGRCSTYRWKYHCPRSRSVGDGRATIRATRGLRYCVIRLIVPPLPAASRPSKTITIRWPSALTHSWTFTSSAWSRYSSAS